MQYLQLLALAASASAWTFQAFDGTGCSGNGGSKIETKPPGNNVCSNVGGRTSYQLDMLASDTVTSLTINSYGDGDCGGTNFASVVQSAGCYEFNTGTSSVEIIAN